MGQQNEPVMFGEKKRKLSLNRETVRAPTGREMQRVVGGQLFDPTVIACTTGACTCTCKCTGDFNMERILLPKVRF
jgi:hypothetical protein